MLVLDALQGEADQQLQHEKQKEEKKKAAAAESAAAEAGSGGSTKSSPSVATARTAAATTASSSSSETVTSEGTSSSEEDRSVSLPLQQVGEVRLFGECRIVALLHMASSLLASGQPHASKKTCEQAQNVLKRYSGREYLERSEYKSTLKKLVSLQKQIKVVKKRSRQAIKSRNLSGDNNLAAIMGVGGILDSPDPRTRKIRWFDDSPPNKKGADADDGKPVVFDDDNTETEAGDGDDDNIVVARSTTAWYRRPQTVVACGTVVVGALVLAQYLMNRRRRGGGLGGGLGGFSLFRR
jgi:hypothetical protein